MTVSFVEINKCKIAYAEKNPKATNTIFFIPGNSTSYRIWRKQYESNELAAFRMVAIDFPAHGDSEITDEKQYSLPGIAALLYKVINQVSNGGPYILCGISLGTNVVAEMLAFQNLPAGLILAGPCVLGINYTVDKIAKLNTHVGVVFTDLPDEKDLVAYAHETFLSDEIEDLKVFLEDFRIVKAPFRSTLGKSIADADYHDEVALLKEKNIPTMMVFGKDERVVDCDYLDDAGLSLWNRTIYKIDGASHLVNIDQPEKLNHLIKKFAEDIFR
jgi:pimeloyl-ACP methyl ester carboxylesterase